MNFTTFFANRPPFQTRFSALSLFMLLSACTVGPDFMQPEPSTSQHYDQQAEQRLANSATQRIEPGKAVTGDW